MDMTHGLDRAMGEGDVASETLRWRVLEKYDGLSRAERRVADTVLRLGPRLLERTIADLARESDVSEPTVVRFCTSVGFRGIKELRRAVDLRPPAASPAPERSGLDDGTFEEQILTFVTQAMHDVLRDTREALDRTRVARAVDVMAEARSVRIAALGGSAIAARHAEHYFRRLGVPCAQVNVYDPRDVSVERYERGDVLLAISRSGTNPLVLEIASDAKLKGATVVCITSWGGNPLHGLADVSLQTPFGGPGAIDGLHAVERTSQIAVLNVLIACMHRRRNLKRAHGNAASGLLPS